MTVLQLRKILNTLIFEGLGDETIETSCGGNAGCSPTFLKIGPTQEDDSAVYIIKGDEATKKPLSPNEESTKIIPMEEYSVNFNGEGIICFSKEMRDYLMAVSLP